MFKPGDKVRIKERCSGTIEGEISTVDLSGYGLVEPGKNCSCTNYWESVNKEELLTNETKMQKLNSMLKRLLDKDMQTLYKAGYLDGDLKLTTLGQEALNSLVFDLVKEKLVESAKEDIAEAKEDK